MVNKIEIIIAEPSPIIREGLAAILQQQSSHDIVITQIADIASRASINRTIIPDILIVNPSQIGSMPLSQIREEMGNEEMKIVALQSTLLDQSALHNYDATISIYDSPEVIGERVELLTKENDEGSIKRELSLREKEVIVCVVKGLTNKQIADELNLSTHTVIAHRRNITSKLQIFSPSGLTIYAIVNNLVNLSDIKNSISSPEREAAE